MDTLIMKMCLPFSAGPEGLQELEKITERFEEKLYTDATSQSDYLQKIRLTMMMTKRTNVGSSCETEENSESQKPE